MLRFKAGSFYRAMAALSNVQAALFALATTKSEIAKITKAQNSVSPTVGPDMAKLVSGYIRDLSSELEILGTHLTATAVNRLGARLSNDDSLTHEQFCNAVADIDERLRDELNLIYTFVLSADRAKYFETKEPLFGQMIFDRLPFAIPDIEDAGRCLALNQGTATVFHLMRVMEAGLRALGKMLGIPYAPSWESYITQINSKIAAKHKTKGVKWKTDESFYRDIAGDLQTIKIAWRNPTMHIVRRYSPDEAEEIFRAVRGFLMRLAPRLQKSELEKLIG